MDAGSMAGLGAGLSSVGDTLGTMAQDQFKGQVDAANRAQKAALQSQQQKFDMDKTQYTVGHEDARSAASLAQNDDHFGQTFAQTQANQANEAQNRDANTAIHGAEANASIANIGNEISTRNMKTPAEIDELRARAAGAEANVTGIPKAAVAAATKEYDQAYKQLEVAQKAVTDAGKHQFNTDAQKSAASALSDAQDRASKAQQRLDTFSGVPADDGSGGNSTGAGIAPAASPKAPASKARQAGGSPVKIASDADYAQLPSGTQFIGPDSQLRVKP